MFNELSKDLSTSTSLGWGGLNILTDPRYFCSGGLSVNLNPSLS